MNVIEEQTELFDLFGEKGTCVVCQEDFQDGERVRALTKCQHMFHMTCIDPWLLQKSECPLCRSTILGSPQTIYQNIRNLYAELQLNPLSVPRGLLTEVLSQMEIIMNSVQPVELGLQRYFITYCLIQGILKKFPKAPQYNEKITEIRTRATNFHLNNIRPYPIDFDSHASLMRSKYRMLSEIRQRMPWQGSTRSLHRQQTIVTVHNELALITGLGAIWQA
jgi:hypothetical protein